MGRPRKVTTDSLQDRENMKTHTPTAFTTVRKKTFVIVVALLIDVVSDVRRDTVSPVMMIS